MDDDSYTLFKHHQGLGPFSFVSVLAKNFKRWLPTFSVPAPRDGSPLASSAVRTLNSKLPKDVDK